MSTIKLYTTDCPKCRILETKLNQKHVEFEVEKDIDVMLSKGLQSAPNLEIEAGKILNYVDAVAWVNAI